MKKQISGRCRTAAEKSIAIVLVFLCVLIPMCSALALEAAYEPSVAYKMSKYYSALTDIELTGNYPTDLVNIAMSQVGYHEGNTAADLGGGNKYGKKNYTEYGAYFACQDSWCAMFVSWCARQAHIPYDDINSTGFADASDFGVEYMSKEEYSPKMGDLIFFDWEEDGFCLDEPASEHGDHVGIVYYADEEYVFYVDGNFCNRVAKHYTPIDDINVKGYGICPVGEEIVYDEPLYPGSTEDAELTEKISDEALDNAPGADNPFADVCEDDYYYDAVMWGVENDTVSGVDDVIFAPDNTCSRAELVTFIWKACGYHQPVISECPFADVNEDAYYYEAVLWCYENGYVEGTDENLFSPDETTDRAQVVTILHRIAGSSDADAECPFEDVDEREYYYDAVIWAINNGITDGTSDTEFSPYQTCTRAQMITFLFRFMKSC